METFTWLALLNVIAVDLVLSGDNALVIGLAVRRLPAQLARRAAIAGAALAIFLRVAFTGAAAVLLGVPFMQAVGGLTLLWIAAQLASGEDHAEGDGNVDAAGNALPTGFWTAVRTIVVADVVMSLDNVLAVGGAAHGNLGLVLVGLLVSIPLVLGGSTIVTSALHRWPILSVAGAAVLAGTAGQMIAGDRMVVAFLTNADLQPLASAAPVMAAAVIAGITICSRHKAAIVIRPKF